MSETYWPWVLEQKEYQIGTVGHSDCDDTGMLMTLWWWEF